MLPILLVATAVLARDSGMFIYPAKGQSQEKQDKDRHEYHTWAVKQIGFDPSNPRVSTPAGAASQPYQPSCFEVRGSRAAVRPGRSGELRFNEAKDSDFNKPAGSSEGH